IGCESVRQEYDARGQVPDRSRATLWVLPVEGVPATAADGDRVVVGLLVRPARGLKPGHYRRDYHSNDDRFRSRDLADLAPDTLSDFRRRLLFDLLRLRLHHDGRVDGGAY